MTKFISYFTRKRFAVKRRIPLCSKHRKTDAISLFFPIKKAQNRRRAHSAVKNFVMPVGKHKVMASVTGLPPTLGSYLNVSLKETVFLNISPIRKKVNFSFFQQKLIYNMLEKKFTTHITKVDVNIKTTNSKNINISPAIEYPM